MSRGELKRLYERIVEDGVRAANQLPHNARQQAIAAANRRWRATVAAFGRHHPAELSQFRAESRLEQTTSVEGRVVETSDDGGMTFRPPA